MTCQRGHGDHTDAQPELSNSAKVIVRAILADWRAAPGPLSLYKEAKDIGSRMRRWAELYLMNDTGNTTTNQSNQATAKLATHQQRQHPSSRSYQSRNVANTTTTDTMTNVSVVAEPTTDPGKPQRSHVRPPPGKRKRGRPRKPSRLRKKAPDYTCKTKVMPSTISGAGLGLFLIEDAVEGDRVAKYSGRVINAQQAAKSASKYLFQVNKNTVLDAQNERYYPGRYINDGPHSNRTINCRFGAGRSTTTEPTTGHEYISIFATKTIKASSDRPVELVLDYGGKCYWPAGDSTPCGVPARLIGRAPPKKLLTRERAKPPPTRVHRQKPEAPQPSDAQRPQPKQHRRTPKHNANLPRRRQKPETPQPNDSRQPYPKRYWRVPKRSSKKTTAPTNDGNLSSTQTS